MSSSPPPQVKPPTLRASKQKKELRPQVRFGIGEWYGRSFVSLSPEERRSYAKMQSQEEKPAQLCPFQSTAERTVDCWKPGGICSLRSYQKSTSTGLVQVNPQGSTLRTTCPSRFEEGKKIYSWIGEFILSDPGAVPIGEVPFLQRVPRIDNASPQLKREVGRIDNVLVVLNGGLLEWCPVEKQAVYFSGRKMALDFRYIAEFSGEGLPFPQVNRRPDYRSSGPKRLLPQLQVKVPALRTWGKKMAVVVDEDFFNELGNISVANDLSNAEVIWFVVRYVENPDGTIQLDRSREPFMTTLEESIRGLVAAVPIPRPKFEETIRAKFRRVTAEAS